MADNDDILRLIASDFEALVRVLEDAIDNETHDALQLSKLQIAKELAERGAALARSGIRRA